MLEDKMQAMIAERMVTRVARAIAESLGSKNWQSYLHAANAAVAEMREPTIEMLEAAAGGLPDWSPLSEDWQKMIDCVLEEELGWPR
jgi:hypothetical protein